jgi:pimeloyl-ACP methyl ester carboxylesterase
MVLIATAPRIKLHPDLAVQALADRWDVGIFEGGFVEGLADEVKRVVLDDLPRLRVAPDPNIFARWAATDLAPFLGQVSVPVLIIVPDSDIIISPRKGRNLCESIPNATLATIPFAGHYVMLERPLDVAAHMTSFLAAAHGETRGAPDICHE